MKVFVVAFLAFASHASAGVVAPGFDGNSAYGYLENVGIPEAERIRKAEESAVSRVDGEVPASLEQIKYEV